MTDWPIGLIFSVGSVLVALKFLLIPSYVSTDFEVHRNWMAVTKNKKLVEWYTEDTSEWTLDYPPFFAYFERILAFFAEVLGNDNILEISKESILNQEVLHFQRVSVILTDLFYICVCALYSFKSEKLIEKIPPKSKRHAQTACFVLLSCSQALLLVDSIHFQYNSMLTAFFILSTYFIDQERYLLSAFFFSILLNFKHIYIYYAFGYVFYYLGTYFEWNSSRIISNVPKATFLAFSLLLPVSLSFGPFLYHGGFQSILDIVKRLFPFSRGLTHAFWAPNFWALYNFLDLALYRVLKGVFKLTPPTYTSGLVQEYNHSVLPNVSSLFTIIIVIISSVLVLTSIMRKRFDHKHNIWQTPDFSLFAIFSSICFFFFGYHVHEKAIILITIPMTIYAIKDIKQIPNLILISTIASFSLFPLLFTPMEVVVKYSVSVTYLVLQLFVFRLILRVDILSILPISNILYFFFLFCLEIYNTFVHKWMWNGKFEFAPLMCISIATSLGVTAFIYSLVSLTSFGGLLKEVIEKKKCIRRENWIKKNEHLVKSIDDESKVSLVGGLDISASKSNSDMAVIALSIYKYPSNTHIITFSENVLLNMPYIPTFLAVREALPVSNFVKKVMKENPEYQLDLLFCDGYGKFHSRSCGMACHVSGLTGIPTIGVAKKVLLNDITRNDDDKEYLDSYMDELRKVSTINRQKKGYIPFDISNHLTMHVVHINGSNSGVFVSTGCGIELELATRIVLNTMEHTTTCEPIRSADLKSREIVKNIFD